MLRRNLRAHGWLAVACLMCVTSAFAAINEPTPLGPDGGAIYKVAFHPTNGSIAYAGTAAGFYRSADGGLTWTLTSGVPRDHIYDFAVDPNNGDRVFIPLGNSWTLHVTSDAGLSSAAITTFPRVNWGPSSVEMSGDGTLYVVGEDRLFRSEDRGQTWEERVTPKRPAHVDSLRVDPLNSNALFVFDGTEGFRSADGGKSWVTFTLPEITRDLVIPAQSPQHIYAATVAGVMVSSNGGQNWASAGIPSSASSLAADPTNPNVLYAGVYPTGLWRTANQGGLWRNVHGNARSGDVEAIAVNPTSPDTILLGGNEGLVRSSTAGNSWVSANDGIQAMRIEKFTAANGSNRIYMQTNASGIFVLESGASRAVAVNTGGLAALSNSLSPVTFDVLAQGGASDRLYVGMNGGIAFSQNSGANWSWISLNSGAVFSVAASPRRPEVILARTSQNLYRSTDSGASWAPTTGFPADTEVAAVAYSAESELIAYAALRTRALPPDYTSTPLGIYRSVDGGATWVARSHSVSTGFVYQIELDPRADRIVYALSELGVFRSDDGGESWSPMSLGTSNAPAYAIGNVSLDAHDPDTIYVTYSGRIARSIDAGESWEEVFVPATSAEYVMRVFADPFREHTLLASTGGGVFELTPGTDIEIEAAVPAALPHGHTSDYSYTVRNLGPLIARDVRTVIQLPATAREVTASTTSGTCTVQGVTVTCTQSALLAGRAAQINLSSAHPERGAVELLADVHSAEPDPQAANNSARTAVLIDQVADLSVSASAPPAVTEGNSIMYSIVIANGGPQEAVDVVATITLAAGLSLAASTSSQGSCTAGASGSIVCSLGNLPVSSRATIALTTNGAASGTYQTNVSVTAESSDTVLANGVAAIDSVVSPAPAPSRGNPSAGGGGGGGGGGSSSLCWISALFYLALCRTNRHRSAFRLRGD